MKKSPKPTICMGRDPKENMYGFLPCPKCGSKYRCSFVSKPNVAQCDDCGFDEPFLLEDDACVGCVREKYSYIAADGDKLCVKCKQKPKCDGCKKRVGRVMSAPGGKGYCGPCNRRRGG